MSQSINVTAVGHGMGALPGEASASGRYRTSATWAATRPTGRPWPAGSPIEPTSSAGSRTGHAEAGRTQPQDGLRPAYRAERNARPEELPPGVEYVVLDVLADAIRRDPPCWRS